MKPRHALHAAALPALALLLVGCTAQASADSMAASMKLPAAASPALVAAPAKHNGSGVRLRYGVPAGIAAGQASTLRLALSNVTAADGARVEVRAAGGGELLTSFSLQRGEQREFDVALPALPDGLHYLDVITTQAGRSSVQSVPVKVGSGRPALKTEGQAQTMPDGERVISLPASQ